MAAAFQLRKSPRKHPPSIVTSKSASSKLLSRPPTQPDYSTAYTSTDGDGDMDNGGRMGKSKSRQLLDEDNSEGVAHGGDVLTSNVVDLDNVCDDDNSSSHDHEADEGQGERQEEDAQGEQPDEVAEGEEEDEIEEEVEHAETSVPKKRRARGPTRCLKLVGVKKRDRTRVFLNEYNHPIGPEPDIQHLSPSIGILAKTPKIVSVEYLNWRKVPEQVKDKVWDMITFKILLDGKSWVVKTAGDSWRLFKSQLKAKYFRDDLSEDEMMDRRPELLVPEDQWKKLVNYWRDPKTIEMSRRNRISVQQRKNVHTAGSRSFARIAAAEAREGRDPSLAAVYLKTRTSKDSVGRVDEKTREELLKLGDDDDQVADYLHSNNLLKKRPGSVLLKERGVTKLAMKKEKYEAEANKKAEAKVDMVRAECSAQIESLKEQFTTAFHNLVAKLQSSNQPRDFASFNPFEGCPDLDCSPDTSYVPDDSDDSESDISLVSEYWGTDEEGEDVMEEGEEND